MKRYDYLLFDADNTLYDFSHAEYVSFGKACEQCGIVCSNALYARYSQINDALWKKLEKKETTFDELKVERFRLLLCENGYADNDKTMAEAAKICTCYMEALSKNNDLVDGAYEVCRRLKDRFSLYLVTNGTAYTQRSRFSSSTIADCFRGMFISGEIGVSKPSPLFFDKVIEAVGETDRSRYLVIGDSLTSDCDGAIGAGLDICYLDPDGKGGGGRRLTYTIKRLTDLYDILGVNND